MGSKMTMEGGALYFAPSSDSTEPIRFLGIANLEVEEPNEQDVEEFKLLRRDSPITFTVDISSSRAWRRIRRIMRKARQKAKREWAKRKKIGRSLYAPESD